MARGRRSTFNMRGTAFISRPFVSVLVSRFATVGAASNASTSKHGASHEDHGGKHEEAAAPPPLCFGKQSESRACSSRNGPPAICPGASGQFREPCHPQDCQFGEWSEWSGGNCTGLCARQRSTSLNNECGAPCKGPLIQSKSGCYENNCHDPGVQDCAWETWSDWSGCSCHCGGGQRSRDRFVEVPPLGSGRMCEAKTKSEIVACNMQPCLSGGCVDAVWSDWQEWSACTATCSAGTQVRNRRVAQMPNECGKPLEGYAAEQRVCNELVACEADSNCLFAPWSTWGDCTCPCSGTKRRTRNIEAFGRGAGLFCEGATNELAACNGDSNCSWYQEDALVDCQLGFWETNGTCSVTCGRGQALRERALITEAKNGGKPCEGALSEVFACTVDACPESPVDCEVGPWSDWGDCNKCGGQKQRFRTIQRMAAFGGTPCDLSLEDEAACVIKYEPGDDLSVEVRGCNSGQQVWCTWSSWDEWSDCSQTCGTGGLQWRGRQLTVDVDEADGFVVRQLVQGYDVLTERAHKVEAARTHDLIAAFALGLTVPLVMAVVVTRSGRGRRATSHGLAPWDAPVSAERSRPRSPSLRELMRQPVDVSSL